MAVTYRVDIENTTGTVVAVFQDFRSLNFTAAISAKGSYQLTLSGFDDRVEEIKDDYLIRVWLTDPTFNLDWSNVFTGIHKTSNDDLTSTGRRIFTSYGPALEEVLEKAYILYPSESAQADQSGLASTVMLTYAGENGGGSAAASRLTTEQSSFNLGVDPLIGGTWSGARSNKNLLEVMREISDFTRENQPLIVNRVDFRVRYLGGYAFIFELGQLGVDRTTDGLTVGSQGLNTAGNTPLIFSAEQGNIQSESLSKSRYNEINTMVGLGQLRGADRVSQVAQDTASATASPIAQREGVINASQNSTAASVLDAAQGRLRQTVAKEKFSFVPRKGAEVLYRDYFLGDYVTAESFRTRQRFNKQLRSITTNVSGGRSQVEEVRMEFEDL